uniref:FHOD1 N-terminal GTPase-binding domain-containing protein n=1 Tax=Xiphophorus couchianus TaxID=32473 RepID=A0A3B5LQ65_9TELE
MDSVTCRVQYLEDSDPFICTNFPEPRRPPTVSLEEDQPLSEQISGIHKLLGAPLKVGHTPNRAGTGLSVSLVPKSVR